MLHWGPRRGGRFFGPRICHRSPRPYPFAARAGRVQHLEGTTFQQTSASEQRHLHMLFISEELGDHKPMQLLHCMQELVGDSTGPTSDSSFLRDLFLQQLPSHVRMVLALSGDLSLDALAQLADKVMEVTSPTISAIQVSPLTSEVDQLRAEVERLWDLIFSIHVSSSQPQRPCYRSQTPSRDSNPHPSSLTTPTTSTLCCYHQKRPRSAPLPATGRETPMAYNQVACFLCMTVTVCFLVDTGAEVSVIPPSASHCLPPLQTSLYKRSINPALRPLVAAHSPSTWVFTVPSVGCSWLQMFNMPS